MLAHLFPNSVKGRIHLCGPLLASKLATVTTELEADGVGARGGQGPGHQRQRQHLLSHHADLHTEDAGLLFGWRPLQAHISAGELHGKFHFDLVGGEAGHECLRSAPKT